MQQDITWDQLQIGTMVGAVEARVTEDVARRFMDTVGSSASTYLTRQADGSRVAPMTIVENLSLIIFQNRYRLRTPHGALQAGEESEYLNPPLMDTTIRVEGTIVEKYEKRGKFYYTLETVATDDRGRTLARIRQTTALLP